MYDETIRIASRFLEATPDSALAHAYLGLALLAKKDATTPCSISNAPWL
jgi:hypothetical protein